jgi:hypothetical protein
MVFLMLFMQSHINGHASGNDSLEVPIPYIRPIFEAYAREYPHKILPYTAQYLHFRILEISHWLESIANAVTSSPMIPGRRLTCQKSGPPKLRCQTRRTGHETWIIVDRCMVYIEALTVVNPWKSKSKHTPEVDYCA